MGFFGRLFGSKQRRSREADGVARTCLVPLSPSEQGLLMVAAPAVGRVRKLNILFEGGRRLNGAKVVGDQVELPIDCAHLKRVEVDVPQDQR